MLKVRVTFVDDEKGLRELDNFIDEVKENFTVISQSEIYKGRGKSIYSNIYLDVEKGR